ncbi:BA75_04255T0 [Komagataella pastoris]|uniref:BA75_04255T0 n=1 Tax=Komagataella pastoris TaxID=4922 RepID=A0A1B2JFK7_PICPA|nr:BA75_04255T0 [Komagataella pastoris]
MFTLDDFCVIDGNPCQPGCIYCSKECREQDTSTQHTCDLCDMWDLQSGGHDKFRKSSLFSTPELSDSCPNSPLQSFEDEIFTPVDDKGGFLYELTQFSRNTKEYTLKEPLLLDLNSSNSPSDTTKQSQQQHTQQQPNVPQSFTPDLSTAHQNYLIWLQRAS